MSLCAAVMRCKVIIFRNNHSTRHVNIFVYFIYFSDTVVNYKTGGLSGGNGDH